MVPRVCREARGAIGSAFALVFVTLALALTGLFGGSDNGRTHNYVTLEFEDGSREEYAVRGRVAGIVSRDDMGIAYLEADYLLDFRRLRV